jgi:hypothetical protein
MVLHIYVKQTRLLQRARTQCIWRVTGEVQLRRPSQITGTEGRSMGLQWTCCRDSCYGL